MNAAEGGRAAGNRHPSGAPKCIPVLRVEDMSRRGPFVCTFFTWGGRSVAGSLQIRTNGAMALLTQLVRRSVAPGLKK